MLFNILKNAIIRLDRIILAPKQRDSHYNAIEKYLISEPTTTKAQNGLITGFCLFCGIVAAILLVMHGGIWM